MTKYRNLQTNEVVDLGTEKDVERFFANRAPTNWAAVVDREPTEADFLRERLRIAIERAEKAEDEADRLRAAKPFKVRAEYVLKMTEGGTFQSQVEPWMNVCFGPEVSNDRLERGDRFLEEVFELLQSGDYPVERVAALRDYVWGRKKGELHQEVGGVMVTLAAYCLAHGQDMHDAGDAELARVWTKIDAIRAKQAAKPVGSALPVKTEHRLCEDEGCPHHGTPHYCESIPAINIGNHVALTYRNYRGEVSERKIVPKNLWWGMTKYHPKKQWFLTAWDTAKGEMRDFALKDFGAAQVKVDPNNMPETVWLSAITGGVATETPPRPWEWQNYHIADRLVPQSKTYTVGPNTMKHVFEASGLTNVSDLQAVLDRVETALAAQGGE